MTWLINEFLPDGSVSLGRLVRNIEFPQQDYHIPDSALLRAENITKTRYEGFKETLAKAAGSKLQPFLTNLFSVSRNSTNSACSDVESAVSITYLLNNSGEFFEALCRDPKARAFLTRAFELRKDVYLVTGVRTLVDAKVTLKTNEQKDNEITAEMPLEGVLLAGGVPLPPGIIGGVGVTVGASNQASSESQFTIPGQVIYAVQFRKLKFRLFSRYDVDKAFLEDGNRWQMFGGARGDGEAESDDDQEDDDDDVPVMEVLVEDETEFKLTHESEIMELGDEQIVFVSDS